MQHEQKTAINWKAVKAVVFDVDGTLYDQSKLRKKMLFDLLNYYLWRPWRFKEMVMLSHFREERERRAGQGCPDLENAQYNWCTEGNGYTVPKLKEVVEQWIFQHPLQYLPDCTYPGTKELFRVLRQQGIKIAIYSDYKAEEKLQAMGFVADIVVSSTDPDVNQLKPDPKGLLHTVSLLGLTPGDCLFIGDRQEMDGECAIRANMPYLIIDKKPFNQFNFYTSLTNKLILNSQSYGFQPLAY